MEELMAIACSIENEPVRRARAGGRPVIGYACLSTPREVFDAAGLFPYRLKALGRGETEMADAYLSRFNCGFCRACLQLGLEGCYDFLDGLIETNGCDHLRGMFENWQYATPRPFFHYLRVPHLVDADSQQWFREEIELLIAALEKHFGVVISEQGLQAEIERQDRNAALFKGIDKYRRPGEERVSGHEMVALAVAEGSMPADEFSGLLENFAAQLEKREPLACRARLFTGGSATDEIDLIAELEKVGGLVVADSFCFSGRVFLREEGPGDPLTRLSRIYLNNLLCPRMIMNYSRRLSYVLELVREAEVDGAVLFHNKFCDLHGIENVRLKMDLEAAGLPVLLLEKEYGATADAGRLKTRIQAFLEQLKR